VNLGACGSLPQIPLQGTWYRAIPLAYARPKHALAFAHTKTVASRFSEGCGIFATFHLAEDQLVALFEVEGLLGSPYATWLPVPARNLTILSVSVVLQSVVDLTRAAQASKSGNIGARIDGRLEWLSPAKRHYIGGPTGRYSGADTGTRRGNVLSQSPRGLHCNFR
jgi:hypothetical protein